jgi:sensor histidine kinase YesM
MDIEDRNTEALPDGDEPALETLDLSTREILAGAVAHAPPKVRRALAFSLLSMLFVVAVVVVDALTDTGGLEPYRLAAILVGMTGLTLLSIATVLHYAGQRRSVACGRMSWFRVEARSLHQMLVVLPVLAIVAAALMAIAIGLFIPSVIAKPIFLIVLALFGWYMVVAIQTVRAATRFLYRHAREQAELAAKAQAEAAEAQLAALQAQMNPHFLFNALNTVASLVRTDDRAAEATVENLAEVLRRTLARSRNGRGTVREELDYLEAYLAVEQERWGDRLTVEWEISSDVLDFALPPMTLQPLVENALKHGLGGRLEGGTLQILARRHDATLTLRVRDDGIGFPDHYEEGTGLGNLRQRLATLYGEGATLRVDSGSVGATVELTIPGEQLLIA